MYFHCPYCLTKELFTIPTKYVRILYVCSACSEKTLLTCGNGQVYGVEKNPDLFILADVEYVNGSPTGHARRDHPTVQ